MIALITPSQNPLKGGFSRNGNSVPNGKDFLFLHRVACLNRQMTGAVFVHSDEPGYKMYRNSNSLCKNSSKPMKSMLH